MDELKKKICMSNILRNKEYLCEKFYSRKINAHFIWSLRRWIFNEIRHFAIRRLAFLLWVNEFWNAALKTR